MTFRCVIAGGLLMSSPCVWPDVGTSEGTVAGWMRPSKGKAAVEFVNETGTVRATIGLPDRDWAVVEVAKADGTKAVCRRRVSDLGGRMDEWIHVAFVWCKDGSSRFYVNGASYCASSFYGDSQPKLDGALLHDAGRFRLREEDARDFAFEARPWRAKEVVSAYRKLCPVDMVMDDAIVYAGEESAATWLLAPAGSFTRPKPSDELKFGPVDVEIAMEVQKEVGPRGEIGADVVARTPFARQRVEKAVALQTPKARYEEGRYRLAVLVRNPATGIVFRRSLFFRSMKPTRLDFNGANASAWEKTQTLFEKSYAHVTDALYVSGAVTDGCDAFGGYLEAGADVASRFADIVTIPTEAVGHPCLLEIEWPDDKPRAMGHYMYEAAWTCRDHLQGGLTTGCEIPNTGRRQVKSYLYYPQGTNALFEARTFVKGRPAAISRLTLSRLAEPLPVLKVRRPKSGKGRTFGHADEDQTFLNNISGGLCAPVDEVLPNLIGYFGYTGQSAFNYAVLRYLCDLTPLDGCTQLGAWPWEQGAWRGVMRELKANGIRFTAQQLMGNAPTFGQGHLLDVGCDERGLLLKDKCGRDVPGLAMGLARGDISKAAAREVLYGDVVPGLSHALAAGASSVSLFLSTNLYSPTVYPDAAFGSDDPKARESVVTEATRGLVERVRKVAPQAEVNLVVNPTDEERKRRGVDVDAIARIDGIRLAHQRNCTEAYFGLFKGKGQEETDSLDILYSPEAPALKRLAALSPGGALPLVMSTPSYFETFMRPLGNDGRFQNAFQNVDIKPHGRWFLKEPAYCLAKSDMLNYTIGWQPLGTLGCEEETREFVRAYSALPARPFATMEGVSDPVVGRYLATDEGVFVYVVNYSHLAVDAVLSQNPVACDLSTGESLTIGRIPLKPFQLRSFLVESGRMDGRNVRISAEGGDQSAFGGRMARIKGALDKLKSGKVDCEAASDCLEKACLALESGRFAEAHFWLYHRFVNGALDRFDQFDLSCAEAEMNRSGRWAVNCGNSAFSRVGGKLFSPDHAWDGRTYGSFGAEPKICRRDAANCDGSDPLRELFVTESYDVDGYRFALPNGRYRVVIHVKWGYPPSFTEAGRLVYGYLANGRRIGEPIDFYAASGGDIRRTFRQETEVDVKDGVLVVESRVPAERGGGPGLFNAIEVERIGQDVRKGGR